MPPTSTMKSMSTLYWMEKTEVGSMNKVCSAIIEAVAWLRVAIRAIGGTDRGRARYQQ
jgi:hypothetical protein